MFKEKEQEMKEEHKPLFSLVKKRYIFCKQVTKLTETVQ